MAEWLVVTLPMGLFIAYVASNVIYLCNNPVLISTDF
jgi:hypothetical protein